MNEEFRLIQPPQSIPKTPLSVDSLELKEQEIFTLSKESAMETLFGDKKELAEQLGYFDIDDIPVDLQTPFPLETKDIEHIPYHILPEKILTEELLRAFEKEIHHLNVHEALLVVRRLLKEVPPESWNKLGYIMDVVFFHDKDPYVVGVFKYEDVPLIANNHLNIRWCKVNKSTVSEADYKPYTVEGSVFCA